MKEGVGNNSGVGVTSYNENWYVGTSAFSAGSTHNIQGGSAAPVAMYVSSAIFD